MTLTELELMQEFGDNLKSILDEYGMSQSMLAQLTGIDKATICRYAGGRLMPSLKNAINIIKALGCEPDELIDFDYFIK